MDAIAPPLSTAELVKLCAVDTDMFGKTFFPKAMRSSSPDFDKPVWAALENPNYRYVNLKMARGFAKTTKLRIFGSKRIAYGISRTILWVGASESHAVRSVQWLRKQIEPRMGADGVARPTEFAQTFGLRPGVKWQEHEIEIYHGIDDRPIWVLGVGITGNIRGINFDDYRPDLIILDDIVTDENALTTEQCNKVADLVMGALANSLTPESEEPNAKMVMLQTPISPQDVSARAEQSAEWHTEIFGCWTPETIDLPVGQQESAWPERYPSEVLRRQKLAAVKDNRYSIFAREMECRLVAAETLSFRAEWLKFYEQAPAAMTLVMTIDPVPPPSDIQLEKGLRGKDWEAISVVGRSRGDFYLIEYALSRGHDPNWTVAKVFELLSRYRVMTIVVETVAFQRVLKWILEKEMQRHAKYVPLKDTKNDRRPKFVRITTSLSGPASQGHLFVKKEHSEFILQFSSYGIGYKGPDDLIESVANGVSELTNPFLELAGSEYEDLTPIEDFPMIRRCP